MLIRRCKKEVDEPNPNLAIVMPIIAGEEYYIQHLFLRIYLVTPTCVTEDELILGGKGIVFSLDMDEYFETVQDTRKRKLRPYMV
jgi:hypothetical protein